MIEIDNKKMWESILGFKCEVKAEDVKNNPAGVAIKCIGDSIKHALKEQNLEYKDGEIVSMNPDVPETDFGKTDALTEFEQCLKSGTNIYVEQGRHMEDWDAKSDAKELLEIARRTILAEAIELAYKTRDEIQYKHGYEKGYEDGKKANVPIPATLDFAPETYEQQFIESTEEWCKHALIKALERNGGDRKKAAKELGISDRTLYRRLKQYGLI